MAWAARDRGVAYPAAVGDSPSYAALVAAPLTVDVLVQVARSRAREVLHTNAAALDEVTNQLLEARGQLLPATKTAQLLAEGIV